MRALSRSNGQRPSDEWSARRVLRQADSNRPAGSYGVPGPGSAHLLALQRDAGNKAVAAMLSARGSGRAAISVVQRACCESCGSGGKCEEESDSASQVNGVQLSVQRSLPCPPALQESDPTPSGFKAYHGNSCWFHCCYRGILEDRRPQPDDPQNECFYDDTGALVDSAHENPGCRGTPNQYDSASDWWKHTFEDEGGIWSKGWGAFWSSRWHDLNQHFEHEGQRMLSCHEVCNQQPWYLRGFCFQGCSGGGLP
jgi:hypothetical protein